jgi:sugar phosphate isomerase/epimerase
MLLRNVFALALAAGACCLLAVGSVRAEQIPQEFQTNGFFIGCQAWTWNHFTVYEAIEKTAQAGGKVIEFFPGQRLSAEEPNVRWGHDASAAVIEKVKAKLAQHGIKAVNYGVVDIPRDEARARKVFEFARALGLRAVTTESADAIDTIERLVKEFDVMVAFHNHPRQPNNPNYKVWDPNYILELVKNRDRRIGACADTGHWVRSGIKPVDALRILKGRVVSSHLKDLNAMSPNAHDVPFGTGVSDIPAILEELTRQGFDGNISVEYEHEMERSMPMVAQCIGFVRGYGQAKKRR